jgi:hypothetical protein
MLRALLEAAAQTPVQRYEGGWGFWLSDGNAVLVKGAIWATAALAPAWASEVIAPLITRGVPFALKVSNAGVWALGRLADPSALAHLSRLAIEIKDRSVRKQLERALADAADRIGLTASELAEQLVPDHGLNPDGTRQLQVGVISGRLTLAPPGRVTLTWLAADGQQLRGLPEQTTTEHPEELRAAKAAAAELRQTVQAQRTRIEDLLAQEQTWPFERWQEYYLNHPVVGVFARQLIWTIRTDDRSHSSAMWLDGRLETADGKPLTPAYDATVTIWHPLDAPNEEIAAWRRLVLQRRIQQPFKQAFRESYPLAPAERETGIYSTRFAAHILRYPQAYALFKARGWLGNALGTWDGGFGTVVSRHFKELGISAHFHLDNPQPDLEHGGLAVYAATDQLRFSTDGETTPLPLADVPPRLLSEAMRDLDLFVSVASIAADPEWYDRGEDRFRAYWRRISFGELTETGQVRRDLLHELIPKLKIADRCEITDRDLVVRGDLHTYRIHIGSGNVLIDPRSRYLCIVPNRNRTPTSARVFLPFHDDTTLSIIISKAVLLANDTKITDPSILRQLP